MIRQWLFNQPARVMDYSTTIESHWLLVTNPPTHQNWLIVRVVNRAQATNPHDWLFVWLIIQQGFDNDCLINQLAWLFDNDWFTMIIRGWSTNSSNWLFIRLVNLVQSTNPNDWFFVRLIIQKWFNNALLIIPVIDYSAMIQQWLFNQAACVIEYSTMIDCHIDYSFE